MLKASADKNPVSPLNWPPAKIIPIQSPYSSIHKQNDNSTMADTSLTEKKDKNTNVKFCEPVFKPKKHEFL